MDDDRGQQEYIRQVLEAYRKTPGTMGTVRRADRALSAELYQRGVSVVVIENALVLATPISLPVEVSMTVLTAIYVPALAVYRQLGPDALRPEIEELEGMVERTYRALAPDHDHDVVSLLAITHDLLGNGRDQFSRIGLGPILDGRNTTVEHL